MSADGGTSPVASAFLALQVIGNCGLRNSPDIVTVMKQIEIRKVTDADVVPLSVLIRRTIRVSNSKDYDQQSIDFFLLKIWARAGC